MTPVGVVAVFVADGRAIAHASDFAKDKPGGFTVLEAQTHRAKQALAIELVKALASPRLYENLNAYDCEQLMRKVNGVVEICPVGYDE